MPVKLFWVSKKYRFDYVRVCLSLCPHRRLAEKKSVRVDSTSAAAVTIKHYRTYDKNHTLHETNFGTGFRQNIP